MPSCLGIYIEKNLIKYAKISKGKTNAIEDITAYGVKFYDTLSVAVKQIIQETQSTDDELAINLSKEEYVSFEVFSRLKPKDMKQLLETEFNSYCAEKGVPESVVEMRYVLVRNTGKQDAYKAICVSANKAELSNLWQTFSNEKLASIAPIGISISNLMKNRGFTENAVVVNMEEKTTVTVFCKGEIAKIVNMPIGMGDVLERLASKYNSYAKAYEACKRVSAYIESSMDDSQMTDDDREVLDTLLPILYDIRERVVNSIEDYRSEINKIYLTGTGIVVNNLDIYFQEYITDKKCEILTPFFVNKDANNLKDIVEVNSAVAIALNGVGFLDKDVEFCTSKAQSFLGADVLKKRMQSLAEANVGQAIKNWFKNLGGNAKKTATKVANKRKAEVDFDDSSDAVPSGYLDDLEGKKNKKSKKDKVRFDFSKFDSWFVRLAATLFVAFAIYTGVSLYTYSILSRKTAEVENNISRTNIAMSSIKSDINYVSTKTASYKTKIEKLETILNDIKIKSSRTYNIPNFLSRMMFVIPSEVKINNITVNSDKKVVVDAESAKYAELGYFVSRIKIEKILTGVNMNVVSMDKQIKIEISGVLP